MEKFSNTEAELKKAYVYFQFSYDKANIPYYFSEIPKPFTYNYL